MRDISDSLSAEAMRMDAPKGGMKGKQSSEEVDMVRAREQHRDLEEALLSADVDIVTIPTDETLPDSVFIEDTAVIIKGTFYICGHARLFV